MSPFAPKLVALPATQQALWPSLSQVPTGFVLYGGTALALRLGHRQSADFDFFTSGTFSPTDFRAAVPFVMAGTKAKAINQRVELKDYLDIAALLDAGMTLPQIVAAAVAIFPGQVDYISTMSAITYFADGEAQVFPEPLKKKLRAAARNASPVPVPRTSFASIVAAAAAVGR